MILDSKGRFNFCGMVGLFLILGIVELLGVSSIAPFVTVLVSEGNIPEENFYFELIKRNFNNPSNNEIIIISGLITLAVITSSNLFRALGLYLSNKFEWNLQYSTTNHVLKHVLDLDYEKLSETNSAEFSRDIINETLNFTNGLINPLLKFISSLSVCLFIAGFLIYFNPLVAIGSFFLFIIIYGLIMYVVQPIAVRQGEIRRDAEKYRFKLVNEALSSFRLFYTTDIKGLYVQEYDKYTRRFASSHEKGVLLRVMPRQFLEIMIYTLIIGAIVMLISQGFQTVDILSVAALFTFAAVRLLPASSGLYQSYSSMTYYSKVIEGLRVYYSNNRINEKLSKEHQKIFFKPSSEEDLLSVEGLSFAYKNPKNKIIKDMSYIFQNNTLYAIAGKTGSGKSTLIEILLGMIQPDKGSILINEVYRNQNNFFGYVPQRTFLFDASICQNIALSLDETEIDFTKMQQVINCCCLSDLIDQLPDGIFSKTGQDGASLSGGQAQRIGIARALYSGAKILILDESTSNLDQDTEKQLLKNLSEFKEINSIIMIAHRLEALKTADKVLYLADETLTELENLDKLNVAYQSKI